MVDAGLQILIVGETDTIDPPMIGLSVASSQMHETNGVMMYGVMDFDIEVMLQTVPQEANQDGTSVEDAQQIALDVYQILADRSNIDWVNTRNGWKVFDIICNSPITEAEEGRRVTTISFTTVACLNQ
jgi:hypothetical protein